MAAEHGRRVLRRQIVQLHEVSDDRLTVGDVLCVRVEPHAVGELDRVGALVACRENFGAGATTLRDDGIAIGQQ